MFINCKTFFSYRYGTYRTEELVERAAELGIKAMALTNINGTADAWDFVDFCEKAGVKPILGTEIHNNHRLLYILLARNNKGLMHINRFISDHKEEDIPYPDRPQFDENVYIIYPLKKISLDQLGPNELIGVRPSEVNKLFRVPVSDYTEKFVIRQPVTFQDKDHFNLHRLLRAVDLNTLLSKLEKDDYADPDEMFVYEAELEVKFNIYPSIIARTHQLLDECGIEMHFKAPKNKLIYKNSSEEDRDKLRRLSYEGVKFRYGSDPDVNMNEVTERVEKELRIINEQGFNFYFLLVWDIISFARRKEFYYVGRGSGANSIIAYLLQITEVDPMRLDLYFERFLNPNRENPPDFDMDFSHADRDEVIQYVFDKYGKEHVSLLGMHSTFQRRAIIRELGKVLGLPKAELDHLAANPLISFKDDSIQRKIQQYGEMLLDFPNHHSIHAGGMLISEEPIYAYTACEMPPKGFATSQMDMFVAEKIGLTKLDVLSQRGLGHIKDALRIVKENKGITINIDKTGEFMKDPVVAEKIKTADTIGCFYIESPAMRQLLCKLKCDDYLTLVAASSIIRPGVAQSGMMKTYIYNYHHPTEVKYIHPKMEELLQGTYGVMVYQEDVIKVAHHFAGLDMAEADILRRAMSGKYRGDKEMERIEAKYFRNCKERGYPDDISKEVWRQIASFSGYSFSKAHSASFAVESYQSLYLKTYHPMEFMVGVINNFGGFYRTSFYFHELKRTGAKLLPPCVNESELYTRITGEQVYVGLIHIERLTSTLKEKILTERSKYGTYLSMEDFIERTQPGLEQLNTLIRIGALRFTGKGKKELLWRANFFQKQQKTEPVAVALFQEAKVEFQLPELTSLPLEDAFDEIEILGFALGNMFELIDDDLQGITYADQLPALLGKQVNLVGQLVTIKSSRTKYGEVMNFGTFLDPASNWLDTVHWPESIMQYPFLGDGFYRMKGKVVQDFGVYAVEVTWMKKLGYKVVKGND